MKKTILFVMALTINAIIFGQSDRQTDNERPVKVDLKKFKLVKEFTVEINSTRSLANFLAEHRSDFYFIDSTLKDGNFTKDTAIYGRKTIVVYRLAKFAKSEEVIAFAREGKLSCLDAQAFCSSIWNKEIEELDIPVDHGIIALNEPKNLFKGKERIFTFFNHDYFLVPYIMRSDDGYLLDVGSFGLGCGRGDYLVFYKEEGGLSAR